MPLSRLFWAVCFALVLLAASNRAHAVIRDGGIDPANLGKGDWIYIMPNAVNQLGGNVPAVTNLNSLMIFLKNQGLRYIIIKAGDDGTLFPSNASPQFTPAVINAAHAAGLWIFGYNYGRGTNIPGEVSIANYVFTNGADGFVYDAEIEWESQNLPNNTMLATQLCSTVRSNWPNKFIALSTWGYRAFHSSFPYKEFAYYCDVIMPQDYWIEFGDTATDSVNTMNSQWRTWQNSLTGIWANAIKPFAPTGQGWSSASGTINAAQITEFFNALKTVANPVTAGGYKGANFWRAELHPMQVWDAIRTNNIGNVPTGAPVVANVSVGAVSDTSATLNWTTDQSSDSVVEYGLTSSYGSSITNATPIFYHTVAVTELNPNTAYHYRVKSKNAANQTGVSADYVFTTLSVSVPDIVIDQDPANNSGGNTISYVGSWTANVNGAAYLGSFRYASGIFTLGSPDRTARFTPNIVTPGNYNVFASWSASATGGNRCTNAPFRISSGGITTTRVSQEANGNSFQLIASNRFFSAGTSGYIELGNDVTQSAGGDIVVADAVKLVYLPPPPAPPVIAMQPESQTVNQGGTATFTVNASGTAPLAYQWRHASTNLPGATGSSFAKINVQPTDAGSYSVVISNVAGFATSDDAVLTVIQTQPPRIDLITTLADGRIHLRFAGNAGQYSVEGATNLSSPVDWIELTNLITTTNGFEYVDSQTNLPKRFYRAKQLLP